MLIEVKEEDWRNYLQKRNDSVHYWPPSENCPIVWALKRAYGVEYAQVTYNTITVGRFPENICFTVSTTPYINSWLKYFDMNPERNFTPFGFDLDLPSDKPI